MPHAECLWIFIPQKTPRGRGETAQSSTRAQFRCQPAHVAWSVDVRAWFQNRTREPSLYQVPQGVAKSKGGAPTDAGEDSSSVFAQSDQVITPVRAGPEDGIADSQFALRKTQRGT